jgi:hypothetical protein
MRAPVKQYFDGFMAEGEAGNEVVAEALNWVYNAVQIMRLSVGHCDALWMK